MLSIRISLILAVCSSALFASGVTIKLSGNQDPLCTSDVICITDGSFILPTDPSGGGFVTAVNAAGGPITELNFNLEYVDPGCPSSSSTTPNLNFDSGFLAFASNELLISSTETCDPSQTDVADYSLTLNFLPGIPDSYQFEISLNSDGGTDPNGPGQWIPGDYPVYTDTPEPGTLAAGAMGLLLVGAGIYRRTRRAI